MNIHPIFVHFPIALLMTYAVFEILPVKRWFPRVQWDSIKIFLVFFGTIGALAAIGTGTLAEQSAPVDRKVLQIHKLFAGITTLIFGAIAAAYVIRWAFQEYPQLLSGRLGFLSFIQRPLQWISDIILIRWVTISIAIIGLLAVSVTGALGGIMVYGPDFDPFGKFIYSLFFG